MNSRRLKSIFVLTALGCCLYGVVSQWAAITDALSRMSPPGLAGSLIAGLAGLGCWMLGWRALLTGCGAPLPVRATTRIMFLGQLGKYVPGSVWALVGQVELARGYGVARTASGAATLLAMATTVATGCLTAAALLPLTSADAVRTYWWALTLTPVLLGCLHPRIVTWALNLVLRAARRPLLDKPVPTRTMGAAVSWTLLGWACFSVHLWLLLPSGSPALAGGAYALAYVIGFLVIFAPGGLGAREAALVLALAPVTGQAESLVVALASRAVLTAADLLWAGVGRLQPAPANETRGLVPGDDHRPLEGSP
ncbi:flippase-like domain-containing protein [Actinocorallia sp. API 0066]|uniref:lysylphosphatidylglycerol synthase transmembrane domain-containing protein n=1 Tax=Actinocorallia sp. API 0066 TaxID=2896846 RepID=UPI001E444B44|nr:lysylphosphatidylglycerol synthase transmembrane domain-containing protein [Actinocorallia sp. API 0066]MCD0451185.1 flippase-like domain-containing protein [Actinocorallia sp. API 0066]